MTEATLAERRGKASERITRLRADAGAKVLDGKPAPSWQDIAAAEAEVAAIDSAEAEAVRRQREASRAEQEAIRTRLKGELAEKEAERLRHVGEADTAFKAAMAAVRAVLDTTAAEAELIQRMGAKGVPLQLGRNEAVNRLSRLMAAGLSTLGHTSRFGVVNFFSGGWVAPDADWRANEQRVLAETIKQLTQET